MSGINKPSSSRRSRVTPKAELRADKHLPPIPVGRKHDPLTADSPLNGEDRPNGSAKSRPKRQAALRQPDYNALHNSIPTSTNKWLDLIANPEKTGRTISDREHPQSAKHNQTRHLIWILISSGPFTQVNGSCLDKAWLDSTDTPPDIPPPSLFFGPDREPIIIPKSKGGFASLGGRVPDHKLNFQDVANMVGRDQKLDVIDVATQRSLKWSLGEWADYITDHASKEADVNSSTSVQRTKVYNVISLEISGTDLAKKVRPPKLVSEIDWVDQYWPDVPGKRKARRNYHVDESPTGLAEQDEDATGTGEEETVPEQGRSDWPKVQLYCLMGMKGSFTEWHLDMGSTSVYYTVHTGSKVSLVCILGRLAMLIKCDSQTFFFIRPTDANLKAYAKC